MPYQKQLELLKQRGHYPFEYTNSFKRIDEIKLPKKEDFSTALIDKYIIYEDYEHPLEIWNSIPKLS